MFGEGLIIKKRARRSPRKTPRKINTEKTLILVVVFIDQNYETF
jgi:hypothetical protein